MSGKVLIGPPKPPDPSDPWKVFCIALCVLGTITTISAYGAGMRDAVDLRHEARVAHEQLERCLRAGQDLAYNATLAAHYTLSGAETMDAFRGMLPAPRIEYTVGAVE